MSSVPKKADKLNLSLFRTEDDLFVLNTSYSQMPL